MKRCVLCFTGLLATLCLALLLEDDGGVTHAEMASAARSSQQASLTSDRLEDGWDTSSTHSPELMEAP